MCYHINITFPPPKIFNIHTLQPHKLHSPKSHGLTAWLWLFRNPGQAKAFTKPSTWPSLTRLMASGRARHSPTMITQETTEIDQTTHRYKDCESQMFQEGNIVQAQGSSFVVLPVKGGFTGTCSRNIRAHTNSQACIIYVNTN